MLKKLKKKKSGFTLIELIIVIAIIAILTAIAIPAFGNIREKANNTTELANARTIYSVITAKVAEGMTSQELQKYERETEVSAENVGAWGLTTIPETQEGKAFKFTIDNAGNVKIFDEEGNELYPGSTPTKPE